MLLKCAWRSAPRWETWPLTKCAAVTLHTPYINRFTERDGRKGPPAKNNARPKINTPHSKATQRKAKPNQKPQTHTQGERQAKTTSAEDRERLRIGARPAARVAKHAPD
jgi:hypothetical protein